MKHGLALTLTTINVPQLLWDVNYFRGTILANTLSGRENTAIMHMEQMTIMANAILSDALGKASQIDALTNRTNTLNNAIDFWNRFMLWGLGIAALAAVWIGLATRMVIFRSKQLATAQSQLDSAKERELQSQVAAADTKRTALANRILDIFGARQLTVEQSADMVKKLAPLSGTKVDVYVFRLGNPYSSTDFGHDFDLASTLIQNLRSAGLDAEGWMLESCQNSGASNLVVSVVGNDPRDHRIAQRIAKALPDAVGVWPVVEQNFFIETCQFSNLDPSRPNERSHDAKVSIAIGKKIPPILTPEMLETPDEPGKP